MKLDRLARIFRLTRAVTGQDQSELALEIGIPQTAISLIERGQQPTEKHWAKIIDWLKEGSIRWKARGRCVPDPVFAEFTRSMTNTQIAKALIYIAPRLDSELAKAIMIEAARRLRDDGETQYVEPTGPNNPPLKAYAEIDAG